MTSGPPSINIFGSALRHICDVIKLPWNASIIRINIMGMNFLHE